MSDLISRKEAIEVLKTEMEQLDYWVQHAIGGTKECDLFVAMREQIYYNINTLENLPDVKPEKTGKLKCVAFLTSMCSECGAQFHELEYTNFCPNCGIKFECEIG